MALLRLLGAGWVLVRADALLPREAQGLMAGERVLLYMQNCPQFVVAYYAIVRANAVVVPELGTQTYKILRAQGLSIPPDLKAEIEGGGVTAPGGAGGPPGGMTEALAAEQAASANMAMQPSPSALSAFNPNEMMSKSLSQDGEGYEWWM